MRKALIGIFLGFVLLVFWDEPKKVSIEPQLQSKESASSPPSPSKMPESLESSSGFVERGELDAVKKLVEEHSVDYVDDLGYPLLSEAYRMGQQHIVDFLIKAGADVNKRDLDGATPIFHAVNTRDPSHVRYLLLNGADPNLENDIGQTPLHLAVETGSLEIVDLLLEFGGDLNKGGRGEALPVFLYAVVSDYPKIVDRFVEIDPNLLNLRDREGRDAVVLALATGNIDMARKLREMGVETEL